MFSKVFRLAVLYYKDDGSLIIKREVVNVLPMSDSGTSFESSPSSGNRDSGSHHRSHRRRRSPSDDHHHLSPQCNGAGDSVGDEFIDDDEAAAEDGLSTEYDTLAFFILYSYTSIV